MYVAKHNRIDVLNELIRPNGTFDCATCEKLLGDKYESFVKFCNEIELIPDEISSMEVKDLDGTEHSAFNIKLVNGREIQLEI